MMKPQFTRRQLSFSHRALLTTKMLTELYVYPRELTRLQYHDYADGIITGIDYELRDDHLWLTQGILLWNGELYCLGCDLDITSMIKSKNCRTDGWYNIELRKTAFRQEEPCITEESLILDFTPEKHDDAFSIGRFSTSCGYFKIPDNIDDCHSKNVPSFLNLLDVYYAAPKEATFHPLIFRVIKKFLIEKKDRTVIDTSILINLQSHNVLSLETLRWYIMVEKNKDVSSFSRKDLLDLFIDALKESKQPVQSCQQVDDKKSVPEYNKSDSGNGKMIY